MLFFVTSALAAAQIGWPCQRLNWGWRNVWSTCSIHSFAPAATPEVPAQVPTFWRTFGGAAVPANSIHPAGFYQPSGTAALPQLFCTNAAATGSGITSGLRNRCRRAVDAYGSLVRLCAQPLSAPAVGIFRTPNTVSPDTLPTAGNAPHSSNVAGLTVNAQLCLLPAGSGPGQLNTPANTCPGLLGWFTVVFNSCGFTNAPALTPTNLAATPAGLPVYFPVHPQQSAAGVSSGTTNVLHVAPSGTPTGANVRVGLFCTSSGTAAPDSWNQAGLNFRTSRCRKALDQFGRTAARCHTSQAPWVGPAQAGGYSDPLRFLAIGSPTVGAPGGFNLFAPNCN